MDKPVLTREEIEAYQGLQKTHFLNQNAQRVNKSLGDLTGIQGFGFHLIEIEAGYESSEAHKHHYEDECVYVLEGEAEATVGDQVHQLKAGDFIAYPAGGEAHALKNNGTDTLKCIVVGQRLEHDVADYPKLNKRLYRNQGMPWNLVDIEHLSEPNAGKKA
jgi:uncharacterized cupin superfamily protein